MERNDGGSSPQGRKKDRSSFPGNFGRRDAHYELGRYEPQPSHCQKDEENMMRAVQCPQERYTPYTMGHSKRAVKCHGEHHIHITVWQDKKPLKREMGENTQVGIPGSWFKITIPYGIKYDKTWLMSSLQSHCSVSFTPVDFHSVKNQARFFVLVGSAASALKDVSDKIWDEDREEIPIFVHPSAVPYAVRSKLEPEETEQLKVMLTQGMLGAHTQTHLFSPEPPNCRSLPHCQGGSLHLSLQLTMSKQYYVSQKALDL
ncbi:hypothetical protein MC885_005802 [Smutsia gigantea]|nr:hypothetical protein MC885_005802 [Smutsia gigantea]